MERRALMHLHRVWLAHLKKIEKRYWTEISSIKHETCKMLSQNRYMRMLKLVNDIEYVLIDSIFRKR